MRRFVGFLLGLVMAAGLVVAVLPLGQSLYGQWSQRTLASEWQRQKAAPHHANRASFTKAGTQTTARLAAVSPDTDSPALATPISPVRKKVPWPLTKLSIPDIGLETFIVQGMDSAALRRGPGHDPNSALPGAGNCVVAGHRNVYGSFFYRLDELLPGSPIILENRDGKFTYTVGAVFTTPDTDLTVLQPPPAGAVPLLTLITCTLPHTSSRIILQANLSTE